MECVKYNWVQRWYRYTVLPNCELYIKIIQVEEVVRVTCSDVEHLYE